MFERYTERARRTLFFARYEASQMGATSIDTEHVLLGLLRESKGVIGVIFSRAHLALDDITREVSRRSPSSKKVSTSVEIPFTADAKRVLMHAAEEADRLQHLHIAPEHLLLGLLREERSVAASILRDRGLTLSGVRDEVKSIVEPQPAAETTEDESADDNRTTVDLIKEMVLRLLDLPQGSAEARETIQEILAALDGLRDRLG